MIQALFRRRRQEADAEVSGSVHGASSDVPAQWMPCSVFPALPNAFKKCLVLFLGLPKKPAPVVLAEQAEHFHGKGTWQGGPGRRLRGGCFPGQYFRPFWKRGVSVAETVSQFITSFLSLGFSLGYEPRELKKITKWLHLDEPHSN